MVTRDCCKGKTTEGTQYFVNSNFCLTERRSGESRERQAHKHTYTSTYNTVNSIQAPKISGQIVFKDKTGDYWSLTVILSCSLSSTFCIYLQTEPTNPVLPQQQNSFHQNHNNFGNIRLFKNVKIHSPVYNDNLQGKDLLISKILEEIRKKSKKVAPPQIFILSNE